MNDALYQSSDSVQLANQALTDAENERLRATADIAAAYKAVFDGVPSRDDQQMVLEDIERFCGVRGGVGLLRDTFHDTAHAVGAFRVWQRIYSFRHQKVARPADAQAATQAIPAPTPGGGVAEETRD
jgi:hypothetical protein